MKKIAIFQSDLNIGGIQKSLINLLNNIDYKEYDVDLYLFSKSNFFTVPKSVNVITMKKLTKLFQLVPFCISKKILGCHIDKQYDVSIDFNSYQTCTALNALKVKSNKKVIWCHNDVIKKKKNEIKFKLLWFLSKCKYKDFDEIVCVSEGSKKSLLSDIKIDSNRVIVIPNIIDEKEIDTKLKEDVDIKVNNNCYNLIGVGRLVYQKGYDRLIKLFYELKKDRTDMKLYIVGDGSSKNELIELINRYNLGNDVFLLGKHSNPYSIMKKMDGFIMMSRYEGQGMVFLEAYKIGLDIFMSDELNDYVGLFKGSKNILEELKNIKKSKKNPHSLVDYNNNIIKKLNIILGGK